jgi:hypothetical protein
MPNIKSISKGTSSLLENRKKFALILLSNGLSLTVIVPVDLARKYNIDRSSYVIIEDTQNGVLVKKLGVKN